MNAIWMVATSGFSVIIFDIGDYCIGKNSLGRAFDPWMQLGVFLWHATTIISTQGHLSCVTCDHESMEAPTLTASFRR